MPNNRNCVDMKRKHMGFLKLNRKNHPLYEGVNIIGRDAKAIVLLKDVKFSKQHAMISIMDESTQFISDLCSSNGTKLDDAFLVPYKFYKLTEENQITFSDVTASYQKYTEEPKIPQSQNIADSQTCDHFALTQKLPNETTQNIHDCPTQICDPFNSIKSNTQGASTSRINTQELAIHAAETQKFVTPMTNKAKSPRTHGLANQEETIHDLETQNFAASTQNAVTQKAEFSQGDETETTQIYDDVFAYDTFRQSLVAADSSMYGVEVDETLVTADKPKIISCEDDCDMLTESPTDDFVVTQPSPKRPCSARSPNLSPRKTDKFVNIKSKKQRNSDSETNMEDNVPNKKLFGKLSELKRRILIKKAAKSAKSKIKPVNSDSETDCEDTICRSLNTGDDSQRIIVKPKNRKIIRSDSEPDNLEQKSKPIEDDSATDIEDNLELIKKIDEASKTIDNNEPVNTSLEQKSPIDDDSCTDIEDNLELMKTIDEASRSIDNNAISPGVKNDASIIIPNITGEISVSMHNTPDVITKDIQIIEDDDSTDDDLDHLAPTQKCSIFDTHSSAKIKAMQTNAKTCGLTRNKLETVSPKQTCGLEHSILLAQNQLNRTNDNDLDIYAAATQKLEAAFDTDIHSAQTQKLNLCDFADDMDLLPTQLFTAINLKKSPNHRESIPNTQDFDFLAPTQLLTKPTQDSATVDTQTQDVDFIAPTQLLESNTITKSKPIHNKSQIDEDDYLAPTQLLLPTLQKLVSKPSTSKYISSSTVEDDSIFDAPTQKLSIPLKARDIIEVHNAQNNASTQQLSMTQKDRVKTKSIHDTSPHVWGEIKSSNAIPDSEEEEFVAATQLLSNPNEEKQNITVASASDSMHLYMSEIKDNDLQPNQEHDLSTPKRTGLDKTETNVNQNEIETTKKSIGIIGNQTEPETQLEVDFNQRTQKLYVEKETSRPNNPVANMFDEEETQTQNTEATPNIKKTIRSSPRDAKSDSNNGNDSKLFESTVVLSNHPASESKSLDKIVPKPLQTRPRRTKRSTRSDRQSTDSDEIINKQNDSPCNSKVISAKRLKRINSESALNSNQGNSTDSSLDEEELVNKKRQKRPSRKVMEKMEIKSSSKGTKTKTANRRSTRNATTTKQEMVKGHSANNASTSKAMGDVSNETKQNQVDDYNKPSTSKAGMGDAPSVRKTRTSANVASPLRTSTRTKRKAILAPRSVSDEPIPIIEDADDWSSVESFINKKVLKLDDTESEYTSSSYSTIESRRNGRSHKIEDYSSDDTDRTNSTVYTWMGTPNTKRQKFEPLHVISQQQNNVVQHKVGFTMLNDEQLADKVEKLGGSVTNNIYNCTVLVANKVSRSLKFLIAVGLGKPIANVDWIKESMKKKRFLDPWNYLLQDLESEAIFDFMLKDSLYRAFNKKLLCDYTILLAVRKNFDVLKEIIEAGGGKVISRIPVKPLAGKLIVVGYPDERSKFARYLKQSAPVVSAEAIFSGVLQQKMNIKKYLL